MTTSRAGGLHLPPWGIPHAEPIGSSNCPPLAVIAPPPQTWLLSSSLPCVKGGGTACCDGGIVLSSSHTSTIPQSHSVTAPFTQGSLPLRRELCKAKAFWNHQPDWWFSCEAFCKVFAIQKTTEVFFALPLFFIKIIQVPCFP